MASRCRQTDCDVHYRQRSQKWKKKKEKKIKRGVICMKSETQSTYLLSTYTSVLVPAVCVAVSREEKKNTNISDVKQLCGNSEKPKVTHTSV